jgi:hypothetical protein
MVALIFTVLAFLVSLGFNLLQLRWRNEERAARAEDKAEQKRKDNEKEAEHHRQKQVAPNFYNYGGTPAPILVNGRQHSSQGPFMDLWGLVTVVNSTLLPIKITPLRLVMAGKEWPIQGISFHVKSNPQHRSDRISLRGNDKEDYELHFRCPDDKSVTGDGELWLQSDNRPQEFAVPVRFS